VEQTSTFWNIGKDRPFGYSSAFYAAAAAILGGKTFTASITGYGVFAARRPRIAAHPRGDTIWAWTTQKAPKTIAKIRNRHRRIFG
jgi:hypothetical protein